MSETYKSDQRFEQFIEALKAGKTVDNARRESSLNWNSLYKMKKKSEEFRLMWEEALMEGGRKFPVKRDPRFEAFLNNLREGKTVAQAMTEAGLYWRRLYLRKHTDPDFQDTWDQAMIQGGRQVEDTTDPRYNFFIDALKETGSLLKALEKSGLDCRSLYDYRLKNRRFQVACDKIMEIHSKDSRYNDPRFEVFLGGLRQGHTVFNSMKEAALNWKTLYAFKNSHTDFRQAWDDAVNAGGRQHCRFKAITPEVTEIFLGCIANGETVKEAAAKAGVTLASIYKKSSKDEELEAAWVAAYNQGKLRNLKLREETRIFLEQVEEGRTVSHAARIAGRDVTTFYRLKRRDPEFAERWKEVTKRKRSNRFKMKLAQQREQRKRNKQGTTHSEPFDDPTSHLDKGVETVFESTAATLKKGGTVIREESITIEEKGSGEKRSDKRSDKRDSTFDLLDELRDSLGYHKMPDLNKRG
ncbi:MAG: hypothetical protein LBE27_00230 [Deltaproteobacteria bacterium]|nr:hypothetical protein [Deltaproteobacteria bacterium]